MRRRTVGSALAICASVAGLAMTGLASSPQATAVRTGPPPAAVRAAAAQLLRLVGPGLRAPGAEHRAGATTDVAYYNWSGYAVDNSTGLKYSKVSGSWKQPTVTCTPEDRWTVFWVGLDGYNNGTVEQDGTYAWCYENVAYYDSWWEMYPTNDIIAVAPINPGDSISASVSFKAGTYTLAVKDATTTSGSFTTSQTCGSGLTCARASAEWIAERPGGSVGLFPLAPFGTWSLKSAKATGGTTSGTISTFPNDAITMVDGTDAYDLDTVSGLNTAGNAFTAKWVNSF